VDGSVSSSQISVPHDAFSVKVPTRQMIYLKPDFLVAQVLYVQVPIIISSVPTDKLHVQKLCSTLKVAYTLISYQADTYTQLLLSIIIYAILS
jgi:hypothetical protein